LPMTSVTRRDYNSCSSNSSTSLLHVRGATLPLLEGRLDSPALLAKESQRSSRVRRASRASCGGHWTPTIQWLLRRLIAFPTTIYPLIWSSSLLFAASSSQALAQTSPVRNSPSILSVPFIAAFCCLNASSHLPRRIVNCYYSCFSYTSSLDQVPVPASSLKS
jgi:hypothetical protein